MRLRLMSGLIWICAEGGVTQERFAEWQIVARRAIEASLELADELEAA